MTGKESGQTELKKRYLQKAIDEYEYSPAPEYERSRMGSRAAESGTLDLDYHAPERDVDLSNNGSGAWVKARVWVPKEWLDSN
ncbi:MAG: hypothetical protein WAM04_21885 [Candidatus Sulfotelmatobacter sp.]